MTIVIALLLLFAAVAAWLVLPMLNAGVDLSRDTGASADSRMLQWSDEKDRLVGEMVALDIALAEGRISETDYKVQRSVVMEEAEKAAARLGKLRTENVERAPVARVYPWLAAGLASAVVVCGAAMTLFLNQSDIVAGKNPHADGRIPLPANMAATQPGGTPAQGEPGHAVMKPDGTPDVAAMVARLEAKVKAPTATVGEIIMLARSYRALNRGEESLALYRRALSISPQDEALQLVVASALIRSEDQKHLAEGEQIVDKILADNPKKPEALWLKSLGLIQRQELKKARETLTQLSGLVADNADAKKAVGELLAGLNEAQPGEAGAAASPPATAVPGNTPPISGEVVK